METGEQKNDFQCRDCCKGVNRWFSESLRWYYPDQVQRVCSQTIRPPLRNFTD